VEDFVIASTINFIIAQRLVRKVCPDCAKKEPLDEAIVNKILNHNAIFSVLQEKYHMNEEVLRNTHFSIGAGCRSCIQSGYSGRVGIYELLDVNKEIHDMILAKKPDAVIKAKLKESGYVDMVEDGVNKVINGVTTFAEVIRTTKDN
jgi:type II secretory ATPase GspE/PulE/Tfp pilus assembly ATPase PilB-like protein